MSKTVLTIFRGFLTHHAGEIAAAGDVLESIVSTLPINQQDRARLTAQIDQITRAPGNILASLETMKEPAPVQIKAKDIENAVAKVLPPLLDEAIARVLSGEGQGERVGAAINDVVAAAVAAELARQTEPATETADQDAGERGGGDAA